MRFTPYTLRTALLSLALVAGAVGLAAGGSAALAGTTTGSGRVASEARQVPEFSSIAVNGSIDLVVSQAEQPSLQVQADDNLLPLLETSVDNGRLKIGWKRGESVRSKGPATVTVAVPRLSAISTAGSGDLWVRALSVPALKISLAGSSDASLSGLVADDLGISVAGSGDVRGSGTAGKLKVSIAGSGSVRLAELKADEVGVTIAGSGDADVHAQRSLNISIAGSGDVVYSGDASVKTSVAGSGSVKKR